MMFGLVYIPEIILSVGVLLIIIIDLYLQKHKYFSYLLIQFLLVVAAFYSLTEVPTQNHSSYEFSKFTSLIKFLLIIGALIIFHYTFKHLSHLKNLRIEYFTISVLGLIEQ